MMGIRFTKMHSLGNDFMVIDAIHQSINLTPAAIQTWSHRHRGIGFDQCLVVEASDDPEIDFFYRIFNANGHEVGQCGNGARCLARFLQRQELTQKKNLRVATKTTRMTLQINTDDSVTVNFGIPRLTPPEIPINIEPQQTWYAIPLQHQTQHVHAVNVGNPHAVIIAPNLTTIAIEDIGRQISEHVLFPEQTNVGFMQILNEHQIDLRVYERDCGETDACGSGAVAAVVAGRLFHQLAEKVAVNMRGGQLIVAWPNMHDAIYLTGSAEFVYEGTESICALSF